MRYTIRETLQLLNYIFRNLHVQCAYKIETIKILRKLPHATVKCILKERFF